ncbi:hypothetical protein BGZ99_003173 [Dissophora globulifera]|uniref:Uncharacterized protein n=1 Tax=Dissophora globulifera TaxID=979702 RepID=A0A9P6QUV9_9FUNG|nr:hypothetical protein BGZ99_003173 [Dissophora globulifera]
MEANQDIQKTSSIADNVPPSDIVNATEPALPKDPLMATTSSDKALPKPGPSAELLALTTSDYAVLRGYFKENNTTEEENPDRPIIEADEGYDKH